MSSIIGEHYKINGIMEYLTKSIEIITSSECLFTIITLSLCAKIYFLFRLSTYEFKHPRISWLLIVAALGSSLFGDFAWFMKLGRVLFMSFLPYATITFCIRIAWGFLIIQYQSLALFIQSLSHQNFKLNSINRISVIISSIISSYFFYIAIFNAHVLCDKGERELAQKYSTGLEINVMYGSVFYLLLLLVIPGVYIAFQNIRSSVLPKIVRKQLRTFLLFLLLPYLIIEFLLGFCFGAIEGTLYPLIGISTLLLIYIVNYCLEKVMRMRFLNATNHVQIKERINIMEEFKTMLEQLSNTTSVHELTHITQTFFKDVLHIPLRNATLIIRSSFTSNEHTGNTSAIAQRIEQFAHNSGPEIIECLQNLKLLVHDEIAFDHFYQPCAVTEQCLQFLQSIRADIFLPIYVKQTIVAYIVIAQNSRPEECYSSSEYDAILVFASYLGNVINLLQHKNVERLMLKTKELHDELYYRHQEINQYKESIHSFLRHNQNRAIGIIFYKNNTFTFANQAAKKLTAINLNTQEGHPLTKAFKHVAEHVLQYKTAYTYFTKNSPDQIIILSGVLHAQQDSVIITAVYPDISDLINKQMNELNDPNDWDYLLYLESTHAGFGINQLIPGTGPTLLNLKIELLKAALSKRALLLDMPDDDVRPAVEQIHHISLRETLHTIELTAPTKAHEICAKLFGSASGIESIENAIPLFKSLDTHGTLCIKNIHFLDKETQSHLAEYIMYGFYRRYNNDQKLHSAVRIICSTNQNTARLVQEGSFSETLCNALKNTTLSMPSLTTLSMAELSSLIDGFAQQALQKNPFDALVTLTEKEKNMLIYSHPASLQELKSKVHNTLLKKVRENNLTDDIIFDPAYEVTDPELTHAARLGKQALKDQRIMVMLWQKFKNQNKIALFLGVNRSSVHRRFKEYNVSEEGLA